MGVNRNTNTAYSETCQNLPISCLGEEEAHRILEEVTSVLGAVLMQLRSQGRKFLWTAPNCWELFGADFLVEDSTNRVVLLEVNATPSMAMYGSGARRRLLGEDPLRHILP